MDRRERTDISFEWAFKLSEMGGLYSWEPLYNVLPIGLNFQRFFEFILSI
jgi:hypothetical protein